MYYDFDHPLFLALNFDGGPAMDRAMLLVSGTPMWLPLYALILYLVWRRTDWRRLLLFIGCMAAALVLADMICGIFKHVGVLKEVWPSFPPRLRPMFTPELEGMNVSADSLAVIRRTAVPGEWAVHVLPETATGRYGTVSAHAAVIAALAALACPVVRRRWFTLLMIAATLLICYSRIYLAKHFPMDLLLGAATGALTGGAAYALFRAFGRRKA